MKKALKIILKVLLICVVVGGLGYGGYRFYLSRQAAPTSESDAESYVKVQIGTGNLEKTVAGTGTLSISKTQDITARFPVVVTNVHVSAGEQVKAGDALMDVDKTALSTAISTMQSDLTTAEDSLAQLVRSQEDDATLTIGAAGRVKAIYASVGDLALDVMDKSGALMLLSMDGKMKVSIASTALTVGQTVTVLDGQAKYTGTVESVGGGNADITFTDLKTLDGAAVQVLQNSVILGSGTAQINMPFLYTTTVQGRISKIYPSVNTSVGRRASLFYLTQVPVSSEYDTLVSNRDDILQKLKEAEAVLASGTIVSPIDGIISTAVTASAAETAANTALATLYAGDSMQMVVSVDELDIIGVKVGQEVTVEMDAITDKTYDAAVSYISQIGTSSNGVTTYSVTLDVQGDDQLKIGMNGTATIKVGEANGVVLVPIAALNTSRNGQYVWLYDETNTSITQGPGVRTIVETGLSSETYAEVKSGLKEGDYVLVTRSAADTNSLNGMPFMAMEGMPQMPAGQDGQTRTFPGGGNWNGGGTQNSNGGFQRPGN
jgi:HlyD family secretion protein